MAERPTDGAAARAFVDRIAVLHGWRLNADGGHVSSVVEGLAANRDRHGYYLCPCRDGAGTRELDRDITCPCPYADPDIAEHGHCYCGLFVSLRFEARGGTVEPIPERRPQAHS
jgi:ferredoxin-thioredoxin reductase catalytic chain